MTNKKDIKIVFMGTPDFAVASLQALVEGGYCVVGVVTAPDKPVGRHGSTLQPSAVKQYAESQHLPVMQPEKLRDEAFIDSLRALQADLQIVVAFRMLPEVIWAMPRLGTFNLHASLLPQYRGAAPINWAVINGETQTGATTFFLSHEIDTGRIILQRIVPIANDDDAGTIHDRLMTLGAALVTETVDLLIANDGKIVTISQEQLADNAVELHPAPKIFTDTCRIDWHKPVKRIYDFIRGLSPYPAAWTELTCSDGEQRTMKIFRSEIVREAHPLAVGTVATNGRDRLEIAAQDGMMRLLDVQIAGKKRMSVRDLLNGLKYSIISAK